VQTLAPGNVATRTRRLVALDAARGITIVGMILVNNQGSGAHAFWGLSHAAWNGWSPADLVFPSFLFIVGASMALSFAHGADRARVVRRAVLLVGMGVALNFFPNTPLDDLRVMGVLQRIGLAYLLAALLVLHTPVAKQVRVAGVALLAYWAMLRLPIPGAGHLLAHMTPDLNVPGQVDRVVLGARHVYKNGGYDPEGLLSTIPAVVSVLAGYWALLWLRAQHVVSSRVSRRLALVGVSCVVAGQLWGFVLPVNKRLWTSSFVVLTTGFSLLLLALCYELLEVRGRRWSRLGWPFVVFGCNALVVFIASEELTGAMERFGWRPWLYDHVFSLASFRLGSLLYALAFVGAWWLVCLALWRRRIFVKV